MSKLGWIFKLPRLAVGFIWNKFKIHRSSIIWLIIASLIFIFQFGTFKRVFWDIQLSRLMIEIVGSLCLFFIVIGLAVKIPKKRIIELAILILTVSPFFVGEAIKTIEKFQNLMNLSDVNCNYALDMINKINVNSIQPVSAKFKTDSYYENFYLFQAQSSSTPAQNLTWGSIYMEKANFNIDIINQYRLNNLLVPKEFLDDHLKILQDIRTKLSCP